MSLKDGKPKELSAIIASQNAEGTIEACLSSLEGQNADGLAEIIVVDNSRDGTARIVEERFRDVKLIKVSEPSLVPQLWTEGAKRASGKIIAFTTAHCVPGADWLSQNLHHHQAEYAAVGGAIENAEPASVVQWAVYFCRYAPFMPPFSAHQVGQVAGDNASYKAWVLEKYAGLIKSGFWEAVVNDQLCKDGHSLLLTPEVQVYHGHSFGMGAFCRQRLVHGRFFGAGRVASAPPIRRLLYIVSSPLVPIIFLGKISRQVLAKRRHRWAFTQSLPVLTLFVLCWSLGEFLGYLSRDDSRERSKG